MKSFSKLSNNLVSELAGDIVASLENSIEKTQQNKKTKSKLSAPELSICEDIEKKIDETIVLLLTEKSFGRGSSGSGGFGRGSSGSGGFGGGRGNSRIGGGGGGGSRFRGGNANYDSRAGAASTPLYVATGGGNSSVAQKATQEYNEYKDFTEDQSPLKDRIQQQYWPAAGESSSRGTGEGDPWSAAFISFTADGTGLSSATGHSVYMKQAKRNRDSADGDVGKMNRTSSSKYVALMTAEKTPSVGDIVCRPRQGSGNGWDDIGAENHCDIYVGQGKTIGGNREIAGRANIIGKGNYNKDNYTMIISKGSVVTAIPNNAVASNDSDTDSDDTNDA